MICYPLQYQKLIEKTARDLSAARIALDEATYKHREAQKREKEAEAELNKKQWNYDGAKSVMEVRLGRTPFEAVEQYKADNGSYPI